MIAPNMIVPLRIAVATAALFLTGCAASSGTQSSPAATASLPSASASASPDASEAPSPAAGTATAPPYVLAADGISHYRVDSLLADLDGKGLLVNLEESLICPNVKVAGAVGQYSGMLRLTFRMDRLVSIYTDSVEFQTPSGGKVGMKLADLQDIYGSNATLISGGEAGNGGLLVRVAGTTLGVSFLLDPSGTRASAIGAGKAQALEDDIKSGEGC
jgi:hypothetical protein